MGCAESHEEQVLEHTPQPLKLPDGADADEFTANMHSRTSPESSPSNTLVFKGARLLRHLHSDQDAHEMAMAAPVQAPPVPPPPPRSVMAGSHVPTIHSDKRFCSRAAAQRFRQARRGKPEFVRLKQVLVHPPQRLRKGLDTVIFEFEHHPKNRDTDASESTLPTHAPLRRQGQSQANLRLGSSVRLMDIIRGLSEEWGLPETNLRLVGSRSRSHKADDLGTLARRRSTPGVFVRPDARCVELSGTTQEVRRGLSTGAASLGKQDHSFDPVMVSNEALQAALAQQPVVELQAALRVLLAPRKSSRAEEHVTTSDASHHEENQKLGPAESHARTTRPGRRNATGRDSMLLLRIISPTLGSAAWSLSVRPTHSVQELKNKIAEREFVPVDAVSLEHGSTCIVDLSASLWQAGLETGSVVRWRIDPDSP